MEQLKEQIKNVVVARWRAKIASEAKNSALGQWEEQNRELLEEVFASAQIVNDAEIKLRELTLEAYAQTGNKAPMKGVGIREVTELEYDNKNAFDWAVEHKMALKLDTSAFEKIAKASPLDFVEVSHPPQATIATQLEEVN